MMKCMWLALAILVPAGSAVAQPGRYVVSPSKYGITDEERAACQNDAVLFCSAAYPDEDALLDCMKAVRPKLTPSCRVVFEAGMRRRNLPF